MTAGPNRAGTRPQAPAAIKGWKITYTAGTQAGTITATRNDGADGQCREKDRLEYKVDFLLEEGAEGRPVAGPLVAESIPKIKPTW